MDRQELERMIVDYGEQSPLARVAEEQAISPELAGLRMFDRPLVGVADAQDPCWQSLREAHVVGPHHMLPTDWLPGARSVVSVFFPICREVRESNGPDREEPSPQWLHVRIEGQVFLNAFAVHLCESLAARGYETLIPSLDSRYISRTGGDAPAYTSNWSERHTAYVCGLGTFGLSRGLITPAGMAGRFISVVTALPLPADKRDYAEYDAYCTYCGACVQQCPVGAISLEHGKEHEPCSRKLDAGKKRYAPRYGCGKCQVRVPCQSGIPAR